jgi:oligoendopeptidase F
MANINTHNVVWNLSALLTSDTSPESEEKLNEVKTQSYNFINKWKDRTDYLQDPQVLKEALDEYEQWEANYGTSGTVGYYFGLRSAQEQDNPQIKAELNKLNDLAVQISNDIQFFTMRLAKIPPENQQIFLESPLLTPYKHFLEGLFENAKYLLSEAEEKILTLKSVTSYSNWVRMTSEFLSKEEATVLNKEQKEETKTFSEIASLLSNPNKAVRDRAAQEFNQIISKHINTAEHELNSILHDKKVNDKLRDLPRPDLARHISDDIDSEVVDVLIEAVTKRFDISKRYYELKAKLLGVDKLAYHERNVPYGKTEQEYSYEDAVTLIHEVLEKLDHRFADIFVDYVENGHIDVYPKKGKSGGAFCAHDLMTSPGFVLLNYTGKLNDVLTISHEMGHAINNELIKEKQNSLNADTPLSTAEVASTFMEDFVLQKLLQESDDETKLALMIQKADDDISTIIRQIACYKFEQELHTAFREKGYLPSTEIGKLFAKHMANYMGDFVDQSAGSENWWVYWGHIRRFFYNYSYASGLLISKALQNKVKHDPTFIDEVKKFLAAGSYDSPKNIFAKLGIDITKTEFWDAGLDEMQKLLDETEALAKKLGKI